MTEMFQRKRNSLGLETHFLQVSVSKALGLILVSKATGLETFNITKNWLSETFIIQVFL